MVSTRSVRYKFTEGERVLCYEPDPTKAKVLYDSKVLEVIESKDKRGRRTVEYLIHFQGWNSSWDRCVSEDFVLKDTEENRQLQRDLAEKSQLQLGAYLYRRERKKGNSTNSSSGPAKRPRHGFSDDGSSTSTQPDAEGEEGETGDTDSSSASGSSNKHSTPPNTHNGRASIPLPSALRDQLTFDYHLVVKRGRLSRLPAVPSAAQILESYVKWFARAGAWNPPRARHDPHHRPDMLDVSCRLNLLREVADGLRVYFDFILRGHLLYKQEYDQYNEICGQYIDESKVKTEPEEEEDEEEDDNENENQEVSQDEATASLEEDMKSPKIPEYSHLPPDPNPEPQNDPQSDPQPDHRPDSQPQPDEHPDPRSESRPDPRLKTRPNPRPDPRPDPHPDSHSGENGEENYNHNEIGNDLVENDMGGVGEMKLKVEVESEAEAEVEMEEEMEKKVDNGTRTRTSPRPDREARASLRHQNIARRLRSHKSAVSQSENEEPTPSTSTGEQRTFETMSSSVGSSGSSMSESWARARAPPPAPPPPRNPLSQLLDKVAKWQIIPREDTEHLPCRVYGAIHLARLFVKLPDFLNATQMPDFKLKLILKHIDMFVQYLDEHTEWFGEMYYMTDGATRSH